MLKRLGLSLVAIIACASLAAFGQLWMPFPQIGGPSFCASTVNNNCTLTIPAGPAISGLETIPADTNASGGQSPQTGKLSILSLGAGPYVYNAPVTGATITLTNTTRRLIVDPAGTIAALTIVTPAATTLLDGQLLSICGTQIVTTLTMTAGSGTTLTNAPTAMLVPVTTGAASCFGFIYRTANTTWYRVQ
jgi:hypothetical protein